MEITLLEGKTIHNAKAGHDMDGNDVVEFSFTDDTFLTLRGKITSPNQQISEALESQGDS